jgi:signal transduction histidine kinase/ActR/RegA family two-component response regulator
LLSSPARVEVASVNQHKLPPSSRPGNGSSPGSSPDASPAPGGADADLAAILACLPHACFVVDRQWRLTYANPEAEQLFVQLTEAEPALLFGKDIRRECPEIADSTFSRECCDALAEQRIMEVETFYPALDRWFAVRVCPSGDRLAVFLQDITQRTALTRALTRRAEELLEADRGKNTFLVELAHEVRNALAPVRNALHLIRGRSLGDDAVKACGMADQEVRRLSRLMDDLARLSQLSSELPAKERVNLAVVIAQSLGAALASASAGGRNLSFQLPTEPLWVEGHAGQLEQVLRHLLDNAIKFTRPGGEIRLTAERQEDEAVLRVRDDGVGLAAHMLPHVFNLFMRQPAGEAAPVHGGLGIGLTLVRHLVERHGGAVAARSQGPGRGSEFTVRLPVLHEHAAGASSALAAGDGAAAPASKLSLRVLVVDDSADAAQSLALLLEGWGCRVEVAYDGPAALAKVRANPPELVLMDIGMPGMDGHEVARELRRQHDSARLTLVALTGYGQEDDRRRALEAGFDYHMVKPVDPSDLRDFVAYVESGVRRGA